MQNIAIALANHSTQMDVFVIHPDTHEVHHNGAWLQPWENLGGSLSSIDAEWSGDDGRLELFGVGLDDHLWRNTFAVVNGHGSWSGWSSSFPFNTESVALG